MTAVASTGMRTGRYGDASGGGDASSGGDANGGCGMDRQRLDKWLWHARFFRTRSLAQAFCDRVPVRIDGRIINRGSHPIRVGEILTFALGDDVRVVRVAGLAERRGPPAQARLLYDDLSPPVARSVSADPTARSIDPGGSLVATMAGGERTVGATLRED